MKIVPSFRSLVRTASLTFLIVFGPLVIAQVWFDYPVVAYAIVVVMGAYLTWRIFEQYPNLYYLAWRGYNFLQKKVVKTILPIGLVALGLSVLNLGILIADRRQTSKTAPDAPIECGRNDIEQASRSVVLVSGSQGSGSGFWVEKNILATNNHVVDHNPDLTISTYPARVLATDSLRDIALLEVDNSKLSGFFKDFPPEPGLPLGSYEGNLYLADEVYVIGYPLGRNLSITRGIVSAFTRDDYDDRRYIQTDAAISRGNSGGPVVDRCGRVVGMATQTLQGAENVGYAIEYHQLSQRIKEMLETAKNATPQELEQTYPSEQAEVVAKYYATLGGGDLEGAYDFYSNARKSNLPYESWSKGLSRTVFIRLISVKQSGSVNTVEVHFYATEEGTDNSWEWNTGEFQGSWTLIRESGLWKMDESNIKNITLAEAQG